MVRAGSGENRLMVVSTLRVAVSTTDTLCAMRE